MKFDTMYRKDKIILFIFVSIIILSFLLRIYNLGGESLWADEGQSVDISKMSISAIIDRTGIDHHPPLYYFILHFWVKLFGDGEFSIRFPSVIFGILSVYIIFKLGELIFNADIGLVSSIILSISVYHIRYSQEARSYSLLVLFVLLSNYYLVKTLENKEREREYIIGYIAFSIMMIYTHIYGLFYLIFQNIYYIVFKRKDKKSWITAQCIILLPFILWLPFFLINIKKSIERNYVMPDLQVPTFNSIYETFKIFVGNEQILYIFIIVIVTGLIICSTVKKHNKKDIDKYIFMTLWLFLPFVISYMISYMVVPLYSNRYFIASFPALILLFSKGITNFRKISITLFVLLIVAILQIPLIDGYYNNVHKDQWRDTANYIENVKKDKDIILLYPDFTKIVFGYYHKNGLDYTGINNSLDIKNYINNNDRIWLILSHMRYKDRKKELELIEKELSSMYIKKETISFIGIKINLYEKKQINYVK